MGRTPCCDGSGLKKGPWTAEEDRMLVDYIQKHGHGSWRALPNKAGLLRCGKSCRLRWTNYLRPDIKRGRFSFEEEETIIRLHKVLGNKWSAIATQLPGRTDNEIKNYWNTHIRKRLIRMGFDPVTHTATDLSLLLFSPTSSNNLQNPAAAAAASVLLNLYGLLGQQPATELIRIATNLLSFQCQSSGGAVNQAALQALQTQQMQDPTHQDDELVLLPNSIDAPSNNAHHQMLNDTGTADDGQVLLLHQGAHETGGWWLDDAVLSQNSNISEITDHDLDPFLSQLLTESSCFDRTDNLQDCKIPSGSSTAASSSNIDSPLLANVDVGSEDAEGGDYTSRSRSLLRAQVPYLLDISDYCT